MASAVFVFSLCKRVGCSILDNQTFLASSSVRSLRKGLSIFASHAAFAAFPSGIIHVFDLGVRDLSVRAVSVMIHVNVRIFKGMTKKKRIVNNKQMPFLGLATSSELQQLKDELLDDKDKHCTMFANGMYLCDHAKYEENTKDPEEMTMNDILSKTTDFCIRFDHLPDITGLPLSNMVGHGDIPDNYICVEKGKMDQYVQSIVPKQQYDRLINSPALMDLKLKQLGQML